MKEKNRIGVGVRPSGIADTLSDGVLLRVGIGERLSLEYVDSGLCRLVGYTQAELRRQLAGGEPELLAEEDRDALRIYYTRLMQQPQDIRFRCALHGRTGEELMTDALLASRCNPQGEIYCYISFSAVGNEAHEEEGRPAADAGWIKFQEDNGRLIVSLHSKSVLKHLGIETVGKDEDYLKGKDLLTFIPWDEHDTFLDALHSLTLGGDMLRIRHQYQRRGGGCFTALECVRKYRSLEGEAYNSIYFDYTSEAEAEKRQWSEKILSALRFACDEVLVLDYRRNLFRSVSERSRLGLDPGRQYLLSDSLAELKRSFWNPQQSREWSVLLSQLECGLYDEEWLQHGLPLGFIVNGGSCRYLVRVMRLDSATFVLMAQRGEAEATLTQPAADETEQRAGIVVPAPELQSDRPEITIRTFGYFDVFLNGKAISFPHPKAKELLALLVDRRGGFISSSEAISYLWEDEPKDQTTMARYRKIAMRLKQTLTEYGLENLVEVRNGNRRLSTELVRCDLYEYLKNPAQNAELFHGYYMNNYSWAEETLSALCKE